MSYRHYTEEYRNAIIEEYFASSMRFCTFCKAKSIHGRTLYRWLESDERFTPKVRPRSKVVCKFSYETKIKACKMRLSGIILTEVAKVYGTTPMTIAKWTKIYQEKGAYSLMTRADSKKKLPEDVNSLKQVIKEKEAQIDKLQREIDAYKIENDVYETALKVLKKCPALILKKSLKDLKSSEKTAIAVELRARYKLCDLLEVLQLPSSSYHKAIEAMEKPDKYADIRKIVVDAFNACKQRYGVKRLWKHLQKLGHKIGRDVIRKICRQENLVCYGKSMKRYNSYKDDGNLPVENWLYDKNEKQHFFNPESVWEILGTDVTEFHVNGYKIYLSTIIDLHDNMVVSWSIGEHPDMDLIFGSLTKLIEKMPQDARFVLHSDQGSCYRSSTWKNACIENHILQSMSRKGCSADNAAVEGFFSRLKNEFFHERDFDKCGAKKFIKLLNEHILWYNNERIMLGLGDGMSPVEYRKKFGLDITV